MVRSKTAPARKTSVALMIRTGAQPRLQNRNQIQESMLLKKVSALDPEWTAMARAGRGLAHPACLRPALAV
jgi:hypothetical protein